MSLKLNLQFELTPEQQLEVFARFMANNPQENLDKIIPKRFKEIIKHMLYAYGTSILVEPLPNAQLLKLGDYRSALRGILEL